MYIMVLTDGETFSGLDGCYIARVPDYWDTDEIEEALANEDGENGDLKICKVFEEKFENE